MASNADRGKIPPGPDSIAPLSAEAATALVEEAIVAFEEWRRIVMRGPIDLARNRRVAPVRDRATEAVNAVVDAATRMRDRNGCPLEVRKPIHHGFERKGEIVSSCAAHGQLAVSLIEARVAADRFKVVQWIERGIEAARELRADVAPQVAPSASQVLRIDEARRVVGYGNQEYAFDSARAFEVFRGIALGRGAWVTGGVLGCRPDKVLGRIPPKLHGLIVAKGGAGGGYRLNPDLATMP